MKVTRGPQREPGRVKFQFLDVGDEDRVHSPTVTFPKWFEGRMMSIWWEEPHHAAQLSTLPPVCAGLRGESRVLIVGLHYRGLMGDVCGPALKSSPSNPPPLQALPL